MQKFQILCREIMMKVFSTFNGFKTHLLDLLTKRHKVPEKKWCNWLRGALEQKMSFLGLIIQNNKQIIYDSGNLGICTCAIWNEGTVEVFKPNLIRFNVLTTLSADKPPLKEISFALSRNHNFANPNILICVAVVKHYALISNENTRLANPVTFWFLMRPSANQGFTAPL